jgi:hypothetical protein
MVVGEGPSRALAHEGATVHLAGRTLATLERVAAQIADAGGAAAVAQVDFEWPIHNAMRSVYRTVTASAINITCGTIIAWPRHPAAHRACSRRTDRALQRISTASPWLGRSRSFVWTAWRRRTAVARSAENDDDSNRHVAEEPGLARTGRRSVARRAAAGPASPRPYPSAGAWGQWGWLDGW